MFRGSRAPWGRSEDRCDGAGSEADGTKPPVKPGPKLPVLGVLVFRERTALVEPLSSGLRIDKARGSPGDLCPAFLMPSVDQSSESRVRVRSAKVCQTGLPPRAISPWVCRHAGLGIPGLRGPGTLALAGSGRTRAGHNSIFR